MKQKYPSMTSWEISYALDISESTVRYILSRWSSACLCSVRNIRNRKGGGRPRIYSVRWRRAIVRRSQAEHFSSLSRLSASVHRNDVTALVARSQPGHTVVIPRLAFRNTVRRALVAAGVRCRRAARKPRLTQRQMNLRLSFSTKLSTFDWKAVCLVSGSASLSAFPCLACLCVTGIVF